MSPEDSPVSSPSASQKSLADAVLTPTRKVQALLAGYSDSDSDADRIGAGELRHSSRTDLGKPRKQLPDNQGIENSDDDDDDLPVTRKSRIAARLSGGLGLSSAELDVKDSTVNVLSAGRNPQVDDTLEQSSHGEDVQPKMQRRLLLKKKRSSILPVLHSHSGRQSVSPTSLPSSPPAAEQSLPLVIEATSDSDALPDNPLKHRGSKFLALVEKHRKQRLEHEEAEKAKKLDRIEYQRKSKKPRGSSPADDTDEDSAGADDGAAAKLSEEARPARRAGKKANEEMKRNTQRMARNLQLTHQARTKKKYTKEDLLAKYGFGIGPVAKANNVKDSSSRTASSAPASESENIPIHNTPPTSPLTYSPVPKDSTKLAGVESIVVNTAFPEELPEEGLLSLGDITTAPISGVNKGKARADDWQPSPLSHRDDNPEALRIPINSGHEDSDRPVNGRTKIAELLKKRKRTPASRASDSDSDIEVITSRGLQRKYAAFEKLPQRKAHQAQSYLTLQTLAHLHGGDDKKHSTLTAAGLDAKLRKAAKEQARKEREAKIEELKARGVVVQTAEERERDQQEVEDLVDRARQEATEIQKRERDLAKKDGTYVDDGLDDGGSDDDDADYHTEDEARGVSGSDEEEGLEANDDDEIEEDEAPTVGGSLLDDEAGEADSDEEEAGAEEDQSEAERELEDVDRRSDFGQVVLSKVRRSRIIDDDEEDKEEEREDENTHNKSEKGDSPKLPSASKTPRSNTATKTPQSYQLSARKQIPGLQMSDDLPIGLSQAFAATMAESQNMEESPLQEQDTFDATLDLPSPHIALAPQLRRYDSVDKVSDSQPATQTQPLDLNLSFGVSQAIPESPGLRLGFHATQYTLSQAQFEPTQESRYMLSPFAGNRFAQDTPQQAPHSTVDTVLLNNVAESPLLQRKGRLRRGRKRDDASDEDNASTSTATAFEVVKLAAKKKETQPEFDKVKSAARQIADEAAEESEDEYAGLGGASDDEEGEENEEDREMIDENTQVGRGDEAKLAKLFADRERQQDEAAVSKLMKDITTGALRRKRGVDDLDLSDDEDAAARRRKEKQRQFMKMQRELLKDEAVSKIAEDKKKEAFLRSIEDREAVYGDGEDDSAAPESQQDQSQEQETPVEAGGGFRPLQSTAPSKLNRPSLNHRRTGQDSSYTSRPATIAEIRESVSFLVEEPESQAAIIDLGLSDSEDDQEAHLNLDRHLREAEADENADSDAEDLGDFIVDDSRDTSQNQDFIFKKPDNPGRAPFAERRTKPRTNVVDRLSLLRQASSSSWSTTSTMTKMAFLAQTSSQESFSKVPALLRRATTNSSISTEIMSATGVVTAKATERGSVTGEKQFIRKGSSTKRNAVNYRPSLKEEKMSQRAGISKKKVAKKGKGGFLGGLFGGGDSWG